MAQDCMISIMKTHSDIRYDQESQRHAFETFPQQRLCLLQKASSPSAAMEIAFFLLNMCLYFSASFLD